MKQFIGQYGKIIILAIVILPILTFLLSTGKGSFASKMPEPTSKYQDADSSVLVGDISKRKPPTVVVNSVKMNEGIRYQFGSNTFVDYNNQDGNKNNTTLVVKEVIDPKGKSFANPSAEFVAIKGVYQVKYQVKEVYRSSDRITIKEAKFICD